MDSLKVNTVVIPLYVHCSLVPNFKHMHKLILTIIFAGILITCNSQKKEYEVTTTDIQFENADATLSGIIAIPDGKGPFSSVVFVHGSGPEKSNYFYASFFAKKGIICITFDKRSYGKSTGKFYPGSNTSFENLQLKASDIATAVKILKKNPKVDKNNIGLFGFSQAGWIAPISASIDSDISFMVLISGPVVTTGEENRYSEVTGDSSYCLNNYTKKDIKKLEANLEKSGFDPIPILQSIDVKGLWLFGDRDESIPVYSSIQNLNMLINNYNKEYTYILYKDRDHGLRLKNEQYGPPEEINNYIVDWIKQLK